VLLLFLPLLAVGAWFEPGSGRQVAAHVLVAAFAAGLLDAPYLRVETGRWRVPTSALLTGLFVAMILAPGTPLDIVAVGSVVSILGKRLIRVGREHVFNPAVLGLLWVGWQFGSGESWWGALGNAPVAWVGLLLTVGWFISDRLNKLLLVLTFLSSYVGLWSLASFSPAVDAQLASEMFRAPFVQSVLFLAFFMLTDPPTSPNRYPDQITYGLVAGIGAVAATLLGAGQLYLLVATAGANIWLAGRRIWRRRPSVRRLAPARQPFAARAGSPRDISVCCTSPIPRPAPTARG
jgi:Na+-translocating ferredoxin:NAD+ oxidoreductase RnfD subunit